MADHPETAMKDLIANGLATLSTITDLALLYVAAAAALATTGALAIVTAGYWTCHAIAWASRQPGIRRLEQYANHPVAHAALDNQTRKEKP
jgi:hypothetical protein